MKGRNTIFGISSVTAVVLIMVIMFCYANISKNNEKEQMICKIKEYQNNGYLELSNKEYQELEASSNSDVKERLSKIENNIKLQKEYNENFSTQLDEIYGKEIKVELYQSEDSNFVYVPFNTTTGERESKAKIEYVTISNNQIYEIFYSIEMNLSVYNKYNPKDVAIGKTKKYYKIPYLRDLNKNEIKHITNYNDEAVREEISNAIEGKTNVVLAFPSENINYKYNFLHVQK